MRAKATTQEIHDAIRGLGLLSLLDDEKLKEESCGRACWVIRSLAEQLEETERALSSLRGSLPPEVLGMLEGEDSE